MLIINTDKLGLYTELSKGIYLFDGMIFVETGEKRAPLKDEYFLASPVMVIKKAKQDYKGRYNNYTIVSLQN